MNTSSGVKLWNYTTSGYAGDPVVVNGVVYVGGGDKVYALGALSASPKTLPVLIGVLVVVIIVVAVVLIVRRRLKTKPQSRANT